MVKNKAYSALFHYVFVPTMTNGMSKNFCKYSHYFTIASILLAFFT